MSVSRRDSIEYCCGLKAVFVQTTLAEVAKAIDRSVTGLSYEALSEGGYIVDETVIIHYKNGIKKVNVTMDSYKALAKDVISRI